MQIIESIEKESKVISGKRKSKEWRGWSKELLYFAIDLLVICNSIMSMYYFNKIKTKAKK